jgi:predicted amidohydrolase YtcJ
MNPQRKHRLFPLLLLIALSLAGCPWKNRKADLILTNGTFYTGNPLKQTAEMVAIRGNRILAVGKIDEADRYRVPATVVMDLKGRFGCAGFNDSHAHLLSGGQSLDELDLSGCTTPFEMQRRILERIYKQPWGSWVIGRGWDQNRFPNGEWPTRKILDAISQDSPMVMTRICGHVMLVNVKVLEIAGITAKTPDPPSGEIGHDPVTGEPNGILKEAAIDLVSQYLPSPSDESINRSVERAVETARQFGLTTVQDYSDSEALAAYKRLLDEDRLNCRLTLWFPLEGDLIRYKKLRDELRSPMLRFGLLKGFLDGTMGGRTAAFFAPYSDDSTTSGILQMTPEKLDEAVLLADRDGFQIALHAIGDRAIRMGLDAYELSRKINGARERRHRLEHVQAVSKEDIPRFKALGVIASMQPSHCIFDMPWAEARLGAERCRTAYAWKSLLDGGARLAFGSDWPVAPLNPLIGIYAAVSRCDTTGSPAGGWNPQEKLTITEAIDAYTLGSAYAELMEHEKGSIEQGKLADLVILDRNLLRAAPAEILKTRVLYTIVGGKIVYQSDAP